MITLESLSLTNNSISKLPNSIGNLINLKFLSVSGNKITELPLSIGKLTQLDYLILTDNHITELPEEVFSLPKLITVKIDGLPLKDKDHVEARFKKLTTENREKRRIAEEAELEERLKKK